MRKLTRVSEYNNKRGLHLRERSMKGKGLLDILRKMHKFYKAAAPAVKTANALYRSSTVQDHIAPKSVKKYLNPISENVNSVTGLVDNVSSVHKFLTGGELKKGDESDLSTNNKPKKDINPANDLLKTVAKKVKAMKTTKTPAARSKMIGSGLTEEILKKVISVIAIEMIGMITKLVKTKVKLSDEKSKMLETFLTEKISELLKADIKFPDFQGALGKLGKIITSPLKHMFGGSCKAQYKQHKVKIMKHISTRANKLLTQA